VLEGAYLNTWDGTKVNRMSAFMQSLLLFIIIVVVVFVVVVVSFLLN